MRGNWVTKITTKKIENGGSIFSVAIFVTQPPTHSLLPHRNHHRTLEFAILRLRQTVLRIFNSQNCWWGKLGDKNHGQKNQKRWFNFFSRNFRHLTTHTLPSPNRTRHCNHRRPSMGDENSTKKIKNVGSLIFSVAIFIPPPQPSSYSRYWIFIKHFWEFAHRNIKFKDHMIMMGVGGGEGEQKLWPKKLKTLAGRWKKTFKLWTRQVTRPSRQTLSRLA